MIGNKPFWIVAVTLLLLSGLVSLYHLAYFQKIYPHVVVGNTEASNLTLAQAKERLSQSLPKEPPAVNLVFGGQEFPLNLKTLEFEYLPEETAEKAYLIGRSNGWLNNLKLKWQLWWEPLRLPARLNLSEDKLVAAIDQITGQIEEPPIHPSLTLTKAGAVELSPGKNGRVVDIDSLYRLLYDRLGKVNFSDIDIPITRLDVAVSEAELIQGLQSAEAVLEKQLVVTIDDFRQTVSKQGLVDLVGFEADSKIASLAAQLALQVNRPAQNAAFQFDGQRVIEFKPALTGRALDEAKAIEAIKNGVSQLVADEASTQTVVLPISSTQPEIANEEVNDLGIKELLGKGESTFHGSITTRKHNIALTAERINGTLVPPGEVFSFNKAVGDISAATGYQSAYIIKDGRTILGDGGGVCQDSTTVFRAALNAGLEIIERHPHSYRVTYYEQNSPPGVDATIYSPSVDLKFKNDTPAHILIQTTVNLSTNYMSVEIYGTSDGREATLGNYRLWDQSPPPPPLYQDDPTLPAGTTKQVDWAASGAKAAFDWNVTRNGEVLQQRTFYTNYQPWQAVYLRGV